MPVSWKQAPLSAGGDETAAVLEFLQGPDVILPAIALTAVAGFVLIRRSVRRKRRRLDSVLPYAHAEPD